MAEDRKANMAKAIEQLEKDFGKGTLMKMGDNTSLVTEVIPSGSMALDVALGVPGFPKGRIVEIYGPDQTGKTSLALHAIAESQRLGGLAAYVDAEHALDPSWAKTLGVNVDELYVNQPDDGEQALEVADTLVSTKATDIIVIDSVSALVPKSELEGDMGEAHMGAQARLMSQALRKLTGNISKSNTCVIFINQLRQKIGVVFGNPEITSGGNALKFYASIRIDCRRGEVIKEGEDIIGHYVIAKIRKNKVATPHKKAEIPFYYKMGYNNYMSLVDLASSNGVMEKSGAWYSYKEERVGQGRANVAEILEKNKELYTKIESEVREVLGLKAQKVEIEELKSKKKSKKQLLTEGGKDGRGKEKPQSA
jgi:recombination protein RecA